MIEVLEKEVVQLLEKGVFDPQELYKIIYPRHRVHYSRVREAIHNVKTRV